MFHYSCTKVARKLRRLGYAKNVAARFAGIFHIMVAILGGPMGIFFEIVKEMYEQITIAGKIHADARQGTFLPAVFVIRR